MTTRGRGNSNRRRKGHRDGNDRWIDRQIERNTQRQKKDGETEIDK